MATSAVAVLTILATPGNSTSAAEPTSTTGPLPNAVTASSMISSAGNDSTTSTPRMISGSSRVRE